MSYTLRVDIDSIEIDEDNAEISSENSTVATTFDNKLSYTISLASGGQIYDVPFGDLGIASFIKISSDQDVDVYFNNDRDISFSNVQEFIMKGSVSACQIGNDSGNTAIVTVDIYA